MSNNYWDDEDDDFDNEVVSNDGSDLVKKLRKAKRADEKRIKELTEQLEVYTKAQREQTVKQVLEKKGVNTKAARLILKDIEDISEDTVNNWLDDNADLFGFKVEAKDAPGMSDENRQALSQQDTISQGAKTPDRGEDMELRIENAQNEDELRRILFSE